MFFKYQSISLMITIFIIYLFFIILGILLNKKIPKKLDLFIKTMNEKQAQKVEAKFGHRREAIKKGKPKALIVNSTMIFLTNSFAIIVNGVFSLLILPIIYTLIYSPFQQGIEISRIKPSTFVSGLLYFLMAIPEWITYPLTIFASLQFVMNIFFAITGKIRFSSVFILEFFEIYLFCFILLLIQAFFETLYIRKVLLKGLSGVPLAPY